MRSIRTISRRGAVLLALVVSVALTACDGDAVGRSEILGTWRAELPFGPQRLEHRLELTPTQYVWTEEVYGPAGRPEDGLIYRSTHSGDWRIEGDRLAIRAMSGWHWSHPDGGGQADIVPRWNDANRIRNLSGERMTLTYEPPPHVSYARPALDFVRVD